MAQQLASKFRIALAATCILTVQCFCANISSAAERTPQQKVVAERIQSTFPVLDSEVTDLIAKSLPDTVAGTITSFAIADYLKLCMTVSVIDSIENPTGYTPITIACVASDDWTTLYIAIFKKQAGHWGQFWSTEQRGPLVDPTVHCEPARTDSSGGRLLLFIGRSGMRGTGTVLVLENTDGIRALGRVVGTAPELIDINGDGSKELTVLNGGWGDPYVERVYVINSDLDSLIKSPQLTSGRLK